MSDPTARAAATAWLLGGVEELARRDPDIRRLVDEAGMPPVELREHGFPTLLRAIVAQQVSAAAARSIWGRLAERVAPLTPEGFAALGEAEIRALGFSRQKITYGLGLAEAVVEGRLDLAAVAAMPDEEAITTLSALKGIGRWSAEVYLLFALGRPDVWPTQDLALQVAAQKIKGLDARPTPKRMTELAEPWRPWRGAAALALWHYYRTMP